MADRASSIPSAMPRTSSGSPNRTLPEPSRPSASLGLWKGRRKMFVGSRKVRWTATRPIAMIVDAFLGREESVAHLVGNRRIVRVGDEGRRDRGIHPHAALALLEQRQVFVEAVGGGADRKSTRLNYSPY